MKNFPDIKSLISTFPKDPGVYLMKDSEDNIIYIGKAGSIKKRVSSYFQSKDLDPKTRVLVKNISNIEYIVTDSEIEALLLENTLIKKHKPKFNVRLKDDKRYPYIEVTLEEDYPRIRYTRKIRKGKNRYFGPFTDARAARNTVAMINTAFKLKTCNRPVPLKSHERPCLNYQIKKCSGVCKGEITQVDYSKLIENVLSFLDGNIDPVIQNLNKLMQDYSESFEYEKAAQMRDILFDVQQLAQDQKVSSPTGLNQDYCAIGIHGDEALIIIFQFRKGALIGRKIRLYDQAHYSSPQEILQTFMLEYYSSEDIPGKIILEYSVPDKGIIEGFLSDKAAGRVTIAGVQSSEDQGIISLVKKNIDVLFSERQAQSSTEAIKSLEELRDVLRLPDLPLLIECFDISNVQGTNAVASMVCFKDGVPDRSLYRRYKIRGYDAPNDPGMIHEVVARRCQFLANEDEPLPDLMVIDGGPTQLTRAIEARDAFELPIPIVSIAKRLEEIYLDPREAPLLLDRRSAALKTIQQIRDEAHRFAITYHRSLRDKDMTSSILDEIPDIGDKTRTVLLKHFTSVKNIEEASIESLETVPGVGKKVAEKIYLFFHSEGSEQ